MSVAVLVALGLALATWAAEPPKADDTQNGAMPFTVKVTKEELEVSPPYMGAKGQDFPFNAVKIEGEYWIFLGAGGPRRWMGTNFLNTVQQPDGRNDNGSHVEGSYFLGGMWYDAAEKKLYAPLHCETQKRNVRRGPSPNPIREIHLASSTDKGATWKYQGPLVTRISSDEPAGADDFSGVHWNGGDGDFYLFVDERGGYIYLYSNHYNWGKRGAPSSFSGLRHHVARCAIADKMAPGKWKKFYNGKWEEPGVGGKASGVNGYYIMYNTYLKKYISFNYGSGISVCTDMDKQNWSPSYEIQPRETWGTTWGELFGNLGWHVMNEDRTDIYTGGKTLYFYKYWMGHKTECYRLDLDSAPAKENYGYHPERNPLHHSNPTTFSGPLILYGEAPFYESPDPIENRRTRRLNRDSAEVSASPGWNKDRVSRTAGSSLEFSFKAADVYWRAERGPDMGKADVYLDGALQTTVDTWAASFTPHLFAYVKTGLDPAKTHTLKIVVRGEKNHRSAGTAIKHLSFEYSADTTRALYAFSAIQGKNQWRYQERLGGKLVDMKFVNVGKGAPYAWVGEGGAMIGFDYLAVGSSEPVRTWTAHRAGTVRIEGTVTGKEPAAAAILHNGEQIWPKAGPAGAQANVHDLKIAVKEGDTISFVARIAAGNAPAPVTQPATPRDPKGGPPPTTLTWDPVLTYIEP